MLDACWFSALSHSVHALNAEFGGKRNKRRVEFASW